ncbi:MAG TPA: hypothetical protein VGM01_01930 [Ktedonobacteraceae bacterium]|jgi:hypothetical protein
MLSRSAKSATANFTREQALEQLAGLEVLECVEEDQDGATADGTQKHWHVYHVIARHP